MIRRCSTPTHTFTLPFDTSDIKSLMVIYAQGGNEVFHKNKEDCNLDGNTLSLTLTQEETKAFNHKLDVQVQLRVLAYNGSSIVSDIETIAVKTVLNDEVMA